MAPFQERRLGHHLIPQHLYRTWPRSKSAVLIAQRSCAIAIAQQSCAIAAFGGYPSAAIHHRTPPTCVLDPRHAISRHSRKHATSEHETCQEGGGASDPYFRPPHSAIDMSLISGVRPGERTPTSASVAPSTRPTNTRRYKMIGYNRSKTHPLDSAAKLRNFHRAAKLRNCRLRRLSFGGYPSTAIRHLIPQHLYRTWPRSKNAFLIAQRSCAIAIAQQSCAIAAFGGYPLAAIRHLTPQHLYRTWPRSKSAVLVVVQAQDDGVGESGTKCRIQARRTCELI